MTFKVGAKVRWTSSLTQKEGEIVAIVPVGQRPRDIGFGDKFKETGGPRDHESYIVADRKDKHAYGITHKGKGAKFTLWPRVSLLKPAEVA